MTEERSCTNCGNVGGIGSNFCDNVGGVSNNSCDNVGGVGNFPNCNKGAFNCCCECNICKIICREFDPGDRISVVLENGTIISGFFNRIFQDNGCGVLELRGDAIFVPGAGTIGLSDEDTVVCCSDIEVATERDLLPGA